MTKPRFAWSYSALSTYEQCPKKYYHLKLKKDFKESFTSDIQLYGKEAHRQFEVFFKSGTPLKLDLQHHQSRLEQIKQAPGEQYVEQRLALNAKFEPTGYFDGDVWVRGQADYGKVTGKTAVIFDWKFGKMKDEPDQLELMAALFMAYMPTLDSIKAAFYWAKEKQFIPYTLVRSDLPMVWNKFLPRVKQIENSIKTTDFPARESGLCKRHCPITSCPYNGGYSNGTNTV